MKRRKVKFQKTILFLRIHLRRFFFVSFLLFLLSQKKKQEKPDGKRKKKKGFLGHACRLIKFPCVKRGEFYLLSCVTCGHSTSANSAGPNHSLRIRWFCGSWLYRIRSSLKTMLFRHRFRCGVIVWFNPFSSIFIKKDVVQTSFSRV